MASRFGASSPNTSVTKVSTSVTPTTAIAFAAPPNAGSSTGSSVLASVSAAVAEARKPVSVMPICTVAR